MLFVQIVIKGVFHGLQPWGGTPLKRCDALRLLASGEYPQT
jgi:hypothetical protein